jgi:hypothetical protein
VERRVRDGSRLERDDAFGIRLHEQLEHPVVRAAVGGGELVERERLAEAAAESVDDAVGAIDQPPIAVPVGARLAPRRRSPTARRPDR